MDALVRWSWGSHQHPRHFNRDVSAAQRSAGDQVPICSRLRSVASRQRPIITTTHSLLLYVVQRGDHLGAMEEDGIPAQLKIQRKEDKVVRYREKEGACPFY